MGFMTKQMEAIFPANPVDKVGYYGGRIDQGLLGEPLNLTTDICFFVFILFFFMRLKKEGNSDKLLQLLVILASFIALGSVIFHSYPNKITLKIDMIPINVFGLTYIYFSMRRFFNFSYKTSFLFAISFVIISFLSEAVAKSLKIPGIHHLTSIITLQLIGVILLKHQLLHKAGKAFIFASGLYILALFFRYLDFFIYRAFPLGTHFLWHTFTAVVVVILLHTAKYHDGLLYVKKNE